MARNAVSIKVQLKKDDKTSFRTESFMGEDHVIVPVVMLVEGVLQGMGSVAPELALAGEFGKIPDSWNGVPVVMNHPVVDGNAVSANSPKILEDYQFGVIFNAKMKDKKLIGEAWINTNRVKALKGEVASTMKRLEDGETVEVSTGLFTDLEEKQGKYNGEDYAGIWREVVPDHLAFLSAGVKGACSVEDGCGTPRANQALEQTEPNHGWRFMSTKPEVTSNCSCGGNQQSQQIQQNSVIDDGAAGTSGETSQTSLQTFTDPNIESLEEAAHWHFLSNKVFDKVGKLRLQAADGSLLDYDTYKLLAKAIRKKNPGMYTYVIGFTTEKVVYENWCDGQGFVTYQCGYTVNKDGKVTLADDVEEVNLLTRIVPDNAQPAITGNSSQEENQMSGSSEAPANNAPANNATQAATETVVTQTPNTNAAPVAPATTQEAAPRQMSQAEYLASLPPESREVIESGIRLHNEKKAGLIKALMDTKRCDFTEAELKTMSIDMLERMSKLSAAPSYEGQGGNATVTTNSEGEGVPAPGRYLGVKKPAASAA
jgi:hypothetical protein